MSMMDVGEVRVAVAQRRMDMAMAVGPPGRRPGGMLVLVMLVVEVAVVVLDPVVDVLVFVPLAHVQPHTDAHERRRREERACHRLSERQDAAEGADKRRRGEVGTGAAGAEMA